MAFILASLPSEEDFLFQDQRSKFHFCLEEIVLVLMFEVGTSCNPVIVMLIESIRVGKLQICLEKMSRYLLALIGGNLS